MSSSSSSSDLKLLNDSLEHQSYISGHQLSSADLDRLTSLQTQFGSSSSFSSFSSGPPLEEWSQSLPHLLRWWKHVSSFSAAELASAGLSIPTPAAVVVKTTTANMT